VVWQEYDSLPNPNAEALKKQLPGLPVAERFYVHRSYVSARIKDQMFHLLDGGEVYVDPCRVGGGALARWAPSAAQTARTVFPYAAFTKTAS
jgi:hypothetical protein